MEAVAQKPGEFRIASNISSWGKNPNRLAFMCNISILLLWMFAQIWKTALVRVLALAMMLMLAGLVLMTVSRSGFLSLGLVFLFLIFQKGIAPPLRYGLMVAPIFCALVFFLVLPPRASERLMNLSPDQSEGAEGARSTKIRLETKEHAIEVFKDDPLLGVGPGNFRWLHQQLYPYSIAAGRPPHNSYLWALTEGGCCLFSSDATSGWPIAALRRTTRSGMLHASSPATCSSFCFSPDLLTFGLNLTSIFSLGSRCS
jgi:O-antigen ligase